MIISKYFVIKILVLFFIHVRASNFPCNWKSDVDCWLVCASGTTSDVLHSIEERLRLTFNFIFFSMIPIFCYSQRPRCHADGISLGLFNIKYAKLTVKANWFMAKVKVKYLEFGMGQVNEIEDDAFNSNAFKSVKHLVFTTMELPVLKKGLLNGLESLEILNIKDASLIRSVDMGIIDGMHERLKECTIERSLTSTHSERLPLPIHSFTGSQQVSNLEFMRIRYYLKELTSKSFIALKNIRHLDLSKCGIEYIHGGTFDQIIGTVKVIRLIDNPIKQLPASMFDLIPQKYDTFIFVGTHKSECQCENFPVQLIVKVKCGFEEDECDSLVLTVSKDHLLVGASKSETNKFSSTHTLPSNLITVNKETLLASSTTDDIAVSATNESTLNMANESPKLPTAQPQDQPYFQYLSKHTYLIMVGVVTIILPLLLFLVWFNCSKRRRSSPSQPTDIDLVLL